MEEEPEAPLEEPLGPPPEIGHEDLLMLLQSVPERISDLIAGLDESRLRYRHGPAFPTAGEVAAHTAKAGLQLDVFINAVAFDGAPPPALATLLEAETTEPATGLAEVISDWQRIRRRGIDLLRGLTSERWEATLEDPQRGLLTVEQALRLVLHHEMGHVAQLRNMTALVPEATPVLRSSNGTKPAGVSSPDTLPES